MAERLRSLLIGASGNLGRAAAAERPESGETYRVI